MRPWAPSCLSHPGGGFPPMFPALASCLFISGGRGSHGPRWPWHHHSGFCQAALWRRSSSSGVRDRKRTAVVVGVGRIKRQWLLLGSVRGQRVKTKRFQGWPGKSHPAAAPCPPRHLRPEGFLCRQTAQHLPGQLQAPGLGNAPVWGEPWGPGVCLSMGATPGVLEPGLVWEETPGVLGSALVEVTAPCPSVWGPCRRFQPVSL